jgi:hypothetical protein
MQDPTPWALGVFEKRAPRLTFTMSSLRPVFHMHSRTPDEWNDEVQKELAAKD